MVDFFKKAESIEAKLFVSQDDWREVARLYSAAAEKKVGLDQIHLADAVDRAAMIPLNHFAVKTLDDLYEAIRLLEVLEQMPGLPNWYRLVDDQLSIRLNPAFYGFNPKEIDPKVSDPDAIDRLINAYCSRKGPLEVAAGINRYMNFLIFQPYYEGKTKSLSENSASINAVLKIIDKIYNALERVPCGEEGFTTKGMLHHYCLPKTKENFYAAVKAYKAAIKNLSLRQNGAVAAYTHLIDLLERAELNGFVECIDEDAGKKEAESLRRTREIWYRDDPSRRLMYWEMQTLANYKLHDKAFGNIGLPVTSPDGIQRAIKLGKAVLVESNSNLFKALSAAALGCIYQHRMPITEENIREALKYYKLSCEIDPCEDDTMGTDFTFVGMTKGDLIRAGKARLGEMLRLALHGAFPLIFFPALPMSSDYELFRSFLESNIHAKKDNVASELIAAWYPDYKAFADRTSKKLVTFKSAVAMQKDSVVLHEAKEIGAAVLALAGSAGGEEKIRAMEKDFDKTADLIELFYEDPVMAPFYVGFSRVFTEVHTSSVAITSGVISADVGNLYVSAAAFLIAMVPLIGEAASVVIETGFEKYAEIKLKANADHMASTFPQAPTMNNMVVNIVRQMQLERLQELKDLNENSDRIVEGLLSKLTGKLQVLQDLIAKQSVKSEMERLASQVAMDVIEQMIFSGNLPPYSSPSKVTALLLERTLKVIDAVHIQRESLSSKGQKKANDAGVNDSRPTNPVTSTSATPVCDWCVIS